MQQDKSKTEGSAAVDLHPLVSLRRHVEENTRLFGCREMSLGIVNMPDGYALMLNGDESHFYWLRHDGVESVIHWNRWAVYRGAKSDASKQANAQDQAQPKQP